MVAVTGALAVFSGFAVISNLSTLQSSAATEQIPQNGPSSAFSGFKPGAQITYKIVPLDHETEAATGQAAIPEDGALALDMPLAAPESKKPPAAIAYDFSVQDGEDALDLLLRINRDSGHFSVSGRGATPFSELSIKGPSGSIKTKADWAGLFEEGGIAPPGALESRSGSFEIAFYNAHVMNDSSRVSPAIIKVLTAPGGGGLGSGGVNQYTLTFCGSPPLSVCDTASLDQHIQNIVDNYVIALIFMTEQLSAVMMQQIPPIGKFFDAKQQLETQRKFQELNAEAVKTYHPSEQMCRIGSYIRSLPTAEEKAHLNKMAINEALMEAYNKTGSRSTAEGYYTDVNARLKQFREVYCDPQDNNHGLRDLCQHDPSDRVVRSGETIGATDKHRMNKDIDYSRTVEFPYTLDLDFEDTTKTNEEEDILALARNLYWPKNFDPIQEKQVPEHSNEYIKLRHITALSNLAHNSYATIAGMKARVPDPPPGVEPGWAYMKTLLREFGLSDADIETLVGENPSYYAQMDILTKKIYQNPDFYTNLYDKPTNVKRIGVSLSAIDLMQARDHYEAALRREMLFSAMVEAELAVWQEKTHAELEDLSAAGQAQ